MKAPRVMPLEGVYTHACRHTWVRSREPAGFGIDERRFAATLNTDDTELTDFHRYENPCVSASSAQSVFRRRRHIFITFLNIKLRRRYVLESSGSWTHYMIFQVDYPIPCLILTSLSCSSQEDLFCYLHSISSV